MATDTRRVVQNRTESIRPGNGDEIKLAPGVRVREFSGKACGAVGFSTGSAVFDPGAVLPYHKHSISEAITVLDGEARIEVEGRSYLIAPFDCLHVPRGTAHQVANGSNDTTLVALSAFASEKPDREYVEPRYVLDERGASNPLPGDPEHIVRFSQAEMYELSEDAEFCDLFAARFGAVGICGGYGRFQPGASLPCHIHQYDESITIVEGEAVCLVMGNRYLLSGCDTAFVPDGRPHRFLNHSSTPMAMVWVYAGSEPERTLVSPEYCEGSLVWPASSIVRD